MAKHNYKDKHGVKIEAGMNLMHIDGDIDVVLGDNEEIGFNATNPDYAFNIGYSQEIYPLHQFNLKEWAIFEGKVLSEKDWKNIFRNLRDMDEEDYYDGDVDWVEVIWLEESGDSPEQWCLAYGEELFEDGFKTEQEAMNRLSYLEKTIKLD